MKTLKRFLCVVLALAMSLGICSSFAYAKATVTDVKILTPPSKTTFYKGSDWDYGIWQASGEEEEICWQWESGKKISFLKNAGSGLYPERGMIDMSGLVIEVTYSDKTKKTIAYKETKNSKGVVVANILVSPVRGEFYVGKNKLEVYLSDNIYACDSYEIEISQSAKPQRSMGDVNGDYKINSNDALLVLMHAVGERTLPANDKKYADMNSDGKINSLDALMILRKAVGM